MTTIASISTGLVAGARSTSRPAEPPPSAATSALFGSYGRASGAASTGLLVDTTA